MGCSDILPSLFLHTPTTTTSATLPLIACRESVIPLTSSEAVAPAQKVQHAKGRPAPTPWRAMLLSPAVWAIVVNNFAFHYAFYVVMNWLPTYFNRYGSRFVRPAGLLGGGGFMRTAAAPSQHLASGGLLVICAIAVVLASAAALWHHAPSTTDSIVYHLVGRARLAASGVGAIIPRTTHACIHCSIADAVCCCCVV